VGVEAQCSASIPATVAGTLGVKEAGGEPLLEILKDYLREKRMLLVLDNFEQVLEAAPMVTELLSAAPRLTVLATSCIPLRLYGEHEFTVPPLSLPDPKHPQPVEHLTQYEGVRLFIERAKTVKADFSVTNNNALAVAEICAHLDGLPLAIELAAARIKLLPPQAMLTRLGHRLKLLTGGARDLPERQRTLRGPGTREQTRRGALPDGLGDRGDASGRAGVGKSTAQGELGDRRGIGQQGGDCRNPLAVSRISKPLLSKFITASRQRPRSWASSRLGRAHSSTS
jgi:hypothetical protein